MKHPNTESLKNAAFAGYMVLVSTIVPCASGQSTSAAAAPVVERAFIADAGGDFGQFAYDADRSTDRASSVFFADMKNWGRYEIVPSPSRADWVFQVNLGNTARCVEEWVKDDPNSTTGASHTRIRVQNFPWVEVVMMDVKTMETRRRFQEYLRSSNPFSSYEANFDRAVAALVDDLKEELGEPKGKTYVGHLETPAPIPPQIGSAQTIFVSDISEKDVAADLFRGASVGLHQQITEALRSWGRYEFADKASHADLVLEVSFQVYQRCDGRRDHRFRLFARDPRTGLLLWGLTTHVRSPLLARNDGKAYDAGVAELLSEFRAVAGTPTWTATAGIPANPRAVPLQPVSRSAGLVSATISVAKSVVKSGSELKVDVAVKNSLKQDLNFTYPQGDPLTCMLAVRDADGNTAPVTEEGRKLQEAHSTWQGTPVGYSLHPGEIQRRECPVSELYDLSRAGKYFIHVQQLDGSPAESNTIALTVVP